MPGQPPHWPTRQRRAHKVDIGGSGNIALLQNLEALVDQRIEEPGDLNSWDIYGIYIYMEYLCARECQGQFSHSVLFIYIAVVVNHPRNGI